MTNAVLVGGEKYSVLIPKKLGGSSNEPEISFTDAKIKLLTGIAATRKAMDGLDKDLKLPSEFVVCIRMNPKYSAKSYFPKNIFTIASRNEISPIGSRNWYSQKNQVIPGKLIFARTTDQGLSTLEKYLDSSYISEQLSLDVRRIEKIDLLASDEKLLGFDNSWKEGYVEFVFHPFSVDKSQLLDRFKEMGIFEDFEFKEYDSGITFASALVTKKSLEKIKDYNPLRSVHPIDIDIGSTIRTSTTSTGPQPPRLTKKNKIPVGVLDGGIDQNHPYFRGLTTNVKCTKARFDKNLNTHATWVTGMILFGNLNQYGRTDILPEPDIFIKSFRVLPQDDLVQSGKKRNELYGVIDAIEKIVPENPEIRVYNLSLGPRGPIYDDYLTRFTYSCDELSKKYDVQFCVAVGNDGDTSKPRIQSPADAVNALSVGSYTYDKGSIVRAKYSCIGPGREGNKMKPDLLAFGGCDKNQLHFVSPSSGMRDVGVGYTSLATPQVTATVASLIGKFSLDPLSSRSLLLNRICSPHGYDVEYGHGILPENINEIITCGNGSYTLQYRGRLLPAKFAQLQIPWPDLSLKGKVTFTWTLVVLADVDELSTDEYTKEAMEISFYPNDQRYVFTSPDKKKTKILNIEENPLAVSELLSKFWIKGHYPKSESGPKPSLGESGMRLNMKWDSVAQGNKSFQKAAAIHNPFFHLHCLARDNGAQTSQIDYSLTLTVKLWQSDQDIYTPILERYTALVPITETIQQKVFIKSEVS